MIPLFQLHSRASKDHRETMGPQEPQEVLGRLEPQVCRAPQDRRAPGATQGHRASREYRARKEQRGK